MFWPCARRLGRCGILLSAAVFALAFYSTMTRSVWMGAGLGLAVIAGASMPRNWRAPVLGAAVLLAGVYAAANWDEFVAFKRDKNLTARETADSVTLRPAMAEVAWLMILDHPVFGCGFDQYIPEHKNYLADRSTEFVLERTRNYSQHNLFFGIATETGLVGLGLFLALLIAWGRDAWRLWRAGDCPDFRDEQSPVPAQHDRENGTVPFSAPLWARQQGLFFLAVLSAYLVNGMFHHIALIPMSNLLLFFTAGMNAAVWPLECDCLPQFSKTRQISIAETMPCG